jgi:hypothetical protein
VTDALTVPATVGEFWTLGYLILFGVRTPRTVAAPVVAVSNG